MPKSFILNPDTNLAIRDLEQTIMNRFPGATKFLCDNKTTTILPHAMTCDNCTGRCTGSCSGDCSGGCYGIR